MLEIAYLFSLNFGPVFFFDKIRNTKLLYHFQRVSLSVRPLIQFEKECSRFDKELLYTLKPGRSSFNHHEFDIQLEINSVGLRDKENDLASPKAIFLGDSYTMGWGVDQENTFVELFQKASGLKSLNAGVSSYGTAREYLMFKRLQMDSLKLVVIQFNETDPPENQYFIKNQTLGIKKEEDYNGSVLSNSKLKKYYLFKYIKSAFMIFVNESLIPSLKKEKIRNSSFEEEFPNYAPEFIYFVENIRKMYNGDILITYIGGFNTPKNVINTFQDHFKGSERVHFLNLGETLKPSDYFYLDDHLNTHGHKKVSDELVRKFAGLNKD
ncbi:hypothetical protein [Lacihabitans soyangensis]|uniref:hypothetical protein n=1 Tax=Lacihabitans soyangensis TaxID=869394 RepID=UPI0020CB8C46|nr:hypothetical protein [Lacihabitans soyangensis]